MYSARSLLIGVSFLDFKFFRDIAWPLFERRSQGSCWVRHYFLFPSLQERTWRRDGKGSREKSKADQGGVEPPQKAVKAMVALQRATSHPMGNWSCTGMGWLCMIPRRAHALSMTLTAFLSHGGVFTSSRHPWHVYKVVIPFHGVSAGFDQFQNNFQPNKPGTSYDNKNHLWETTNPWIATQILDASASKTHLASLVGVSNPECLSNCWAFLKWEDPEAGRLALFFFPRKIRTKIKKTVYQVPGDGPWNYEDSMKPIQNATWYCWWKKSCNTWDV